MEQKGTEEASQQLQELDSLLATCNWKDAEKMQEFLEKGKALLLSLSEE